MSISSTPTRRSPSRRAVSRERRMTELRLPPMFYVHFDERERPPRLQASDLHEPEKFHERLAAWLMKQH